MMDDDLQRALALSLEEAKRSTTFVEEFPPLRKVTTHQGCDGITIDGRHGEWAEGEVVPKGVDRSLPRCVCIRMTVGSFTGYTERSLLHTGVSDSSGIVYNFDERGHHKDAWVESINYPLQAAASLSDDEWDAALRAHHAAHRGSGIPYRSLGYNCYQYVVEFLNSIEFAGREHSVESFSKQLEPAILPAIRYVRLYQQLQSEQVVFSGKRKPLGRIMCHEHNLFANPQSGYMCDLCGGSDKRRFTCVMACDFDVCGRCWDKEGAAAAAAVVSAVTTTPPKNT